MNKAKRVAWHKHLKKARKAKERKRAERVTQAPARQTTPRR
ncbi:MAG: hypothetical protein OJF49_003513 [Ktedonobacterales bacterium]|jgi:hypothetical protein|nr:MAG: hypothetical protein OJF49_003513 [Ktedonobacterales bacterium]